MSLFHNSVLNKYLRGLESEKVAQAFKRYTSHFHNPIIQENIRNSKHEEYQGEFLNDLFVNVLGFTKNPTPDFNLTAELKNIKDAKKTDAAILKNKKALAVIELKDTNTTDLSKVENQAFGYKNNQPGCNYVITSNFEKLRFYIDNAVDYEEFNLFQLSKERFELLWLCLSSDYLLKDIPKKIKDESLTHEENVTKKLYKDYASFRNEIFEAIQKENPEYDKLTLFKKTQKLLNRFLFIFFAGDRLLLPPNSIRSILNQWTDLRDKYDKYFPLYDRFKKYFVYMNTGHKGQQHEIFAYNGGLFAPDEILDNIKINDDLLHKHTISLSNYDFESEVSADILGHIFEHSLNDIAEMQDEIQGITNEQNKSNRKKDGVLYTPKYISKYIVDHTVGKLCEEKKAELGIQEVEYEKSQKGRQKATLKKLTKKLDNYRTWLLQITICDPACGSGAFLNQALEFLIAEHQYIDELQAKLFGDAAVLREVENSILENNIYGVDINEESVDIAKLSLWLRTAQKGRKLTSLNNNIKAGNSLIDDPSIAGDKAFNWQESFPTVFQQKEKEAYHIVLTTHNSRTSQRMIKLGIVKGDPIELSLEQEIALTEIIGQIINDNKYHCLGYNVCKDHVHMILVCEYTELSRIVQKIKAVSSKEYNRLTFPMEHNSAEYNPTDHNPTADNSMEHVPLRKDGVPTENSPTDHNPTADNSMEHVPLRKDGVPTENSPTEHNPMVDNPMEHVPLRKDEVPTENSPTDHNPMVDNSMEHVPLRKDGVPTENSPTEHNPMVDNSMEHVPLRKDEVPTENSPTDHNPTADNSMEHVPLRKDGVPTENNPAEHNPMVDNSMEHVPLRKDGVPTENSPTEHNPMVDNSMEHVPLRKKVGTHKKGDKIYTPFWSQKFFRVDLDVWSLASISHKPGYIYGDTHLTNALNYIYHNREKHKLPASAKLQKIIDTFVVDMDYAFRKEYIGGFDVVIGNPPYVQLQKMKELSKQIKSLAYQTYESTGDLYCLFYEKGLCILKEKGLLGYITSNEWMQANYGKNLRRFLVNNTNPYQLLDLGAGIFEAAFVDSNILLFAKETKDQLNIQALTIQKGKEIRRFEALNNQFVEISPRNDDTWVIQNKIEQTIQ